MKISAVAAATAALTIGSAQAKKRDVFLYVNTNFKSWEDMCPDLLSAVDEGVTYLIMAFMVNGKPDDSLKQWEMNGKAAGLACIEQIHAKNAKIMISAGGAAELAYNLLTPEEYGTAVAKWAIDYGFDGVDFDLENLPPHWDAQPLYYDFVKGVTSSSYHYFKEHGAGKKYHIAHAPQAPYMSSWSGPNFGFQGVMEAVGDMIDHLLIQYYNQEICSYDDFDKLFVNSGPQCWDGGCAWSQLPEAWRHKIVVGKLVTLMDQFTNNTGYMKPEPLAEAICRAEKELGYSGGVMFWQYRGMNDAEQSTMFKALAVEECGEGNAPAPSNAPTDAPGVTNAPTDGATNAPTNGATDAPAPVGGKRPIFMYVNVYFGNQANPCDDLILMAEKGVSHIVISFLLQGKPSDGLIHWDNYGAENRKQCLEKVRALGSKVILSTGGEREHGMYDVDPKVYATRAADFALDFDFDGLDFDLESLVGGFDSHPQYQWLVDATTEAHRIFEQSGKKMLILHAPQSPYFGDYAGPGHITGYTRLVNELGNKVDFYLVQFYNQGNCKYDDYEAIFGPDEPGCWCNGCTYGKFIGKIEPSYQQKIVVGKPANRVDVEASGYTDNQKLAEIMCKAEKEANYSAGLMTWSYRAGLMQTFFDTLVVDSCGSGGAPSPPTDSPPTGPTNAPPTGPTNAPVTSPTNAPTPPPATVPPPTLPPASAPFEGTCFTNDDGQWWHQDCEHESVCTPLDVPYEECIVGGSAPKFYARDAVHCRNLQFDTAHCATKPGNGGDKWEKPEAGREECYITTIWWSNDCGHADVCKFEGKYTDEAGCLGSGNPYSVWADTAEECKAAMIGKACSA